jgi:hypothetical protein
MIIENSHAGEWDIEMLRKEFDEFLDLEEFGFSFEDLADATAEIEAKIEPEYPIVPKYSEKWSAVIIVIDNSIDENFVRSVLGLQVMKDYKTDNVGESYVLTSKQFTELWNKR